MSYKNYRSKIMTIKEIAQLAGVSSAAVSRYLNGGYVSEEKKQQIRKVIEKTGYRPSIQARILRTKHSRLIGVVVPKISSESISRITDGIGQVLGQRNYHMLLATTDNQPLKELEYMEIFQNYPVDGIILIATILTKKHRKFLKESKIPIVVIGQHTQDASCIFHDDYRAAKELASRLAGKSRGKIAYLAVTREDLAAGASREDGLNAGLQQAGKSLGTDCRGEASFTIESGFEKTCELLKKYSDIDIIFCATDTIAAGALEAILKHFPERREKITVAGFGDNQFLKAVTGGIPTVHFGYKTSGIKGAELITDMLEQDQNIPIQMKLGYELRNI